MRRHLRILFTAAVVLNLGALAGCAAPTEDDATSGADALSASSFASAEAAGDFAIELARGDAAASARVQDVQTIPSSDPNILSWSAYTLRPESGDSLDPDAAPANEMVFVSEDGERIVYIDAETGGEAMIIGEEADDAAIRKSLARDLRSLVSGTGSADLVGASIHPLGPIDGILGKVVSRLTTLVTGFFEKQAVKVVEKKVVVSGAGAAARTATSAELHLAEKLSAAAAAAKKLVASASRTSGEGLRPLTAKEVELVKSSVSAGKGWVGEAGIKTLELTAYSRALVLGSATGANVRVNLPAGIVHVAYLGKAYATGSTPSFFWKNPRVAGAVYEKLPVGQTMRVLPVEEALAAAKVAGAGHPIVKEAWLVAAGQTEGHAYAAALRDVSHVYCAAPSTTQTSQLIGALTEGKIVHVGTKAEAAKLAATFRSWATQTGNKWGARVDELTGRIVAEY